MTSEVDIGRQLKGIGEPLSNNHVLRLGRPEPSGAAVAFVWLGPELVDPVRRGRADRSAG
jgi:hypothetical protein